MEKKEIVDLIEGTIKKALKEQVMTEENIKTKLVDIATQIAGKEALNVPPEKRAELDFLYAEKRGLEDALAEIIKQRTTATYPLLQGMLGKYPKHTQDLFNVLIKEGKIAEPEMLKLLEAEWDNAYITALPEGTVLVEARKEIVDLKANGATLQKNLDEAKAKTAAAGDLVESIILSDQMTFSYGQSGGYKRLAEDVKRVRKEIRDLQELGDMTITHVNAVALAFRGPLHADDAITLAKATFTRVQLVDFLAKKSPPLSAEQVRAILVEFDR